MFRRLYWVAEQIEDNGSSKVTGVYTSIQDLVGRGLKWCADSSVGKRYRLTLVKPDAFDCPLGRWESPDFSGLMDGLQTFVQSNEYSTEECMLLKNELDRFMQAEAAA